MSKKVLLTLCTLVLLGFPRWTQATTSLQLYGSGVNRVDRVEIPLTNPSRPVNLGSGDFTIEFWMKSGPGTNTTGYCTPTNDGWITGHTIIDRDVYGPGDNGDWGISIASNGSVCFGVSRGSTGSTIISSGANVLDGEWHHVAVTRVAANGSSRIFINGIQRASGTTASGDVSFRTGRSSSFPADPLLVFGAEKHDAGTDYPSYRGLIDEVRLSTTIRYSNSFNRPVSPFNTDANTAGLYSFDSSPGNCTGQITDRSGNAEGPSNGSCRFGGINSNLRGPVFIEDSPFSSLPVASATPLPTATTAPTATPIPFISPSLTPSPTPAPPTQHPITPAVTDPVRTPTSVVLSPAISPVCPLKPRGDADCNGVINLQDLEIWRFEYFLESQSTATYLAADFNRDSRVSLIDLQILFDNIK